MNKTLLLKLLGSCTAVLGSSAYFYYANMRDKYKGKLKNNFDQQARKAITKYYEAVVNQLTISSGSELEDMALIASQARTNSRAKTREDDWISKSFKTLGYDFYGSVDSKDGRSNDSYKLRNKYIVTGGKSKATGDYAADALQFFLATFRSNSKYNSIFLPLKFFPSGWFEGLKSGQNKVVVKDVKSTVDSFNSLISERILEPFEDVMIRRSNSTNITFSEEAEQQLKFSLGSVILEGFANFIDVSYDNGLNFERLYRGIYDNSDSGELSKGVLANEENLLRVIEKVFAHKFQGIRDKYALEYSKVQKFAQEFADYYSNENVEGVNDVLISLLQEDKKFECLNDVELMDGLCLISFNHEKVFDFTLYEMPDFI